MHEKLGLGCDVVPTQTFLLGMAAHVMCIFTQNDYILSFN